MSGAGRTQGQGRDRARRRADIAEYCLRDPARRSLGAGHYDWRRPLAFVTEVP